MMARKFVRGEDVANVGAHQEAAWRADGWVPADEVKKPAPAPEKKPVAKKKTVKKDK